MNNNLNNFNSSSYNINNTTRFSPNQNSPRLNDTSNTISFASLNIRGINDICKFDDILDDLIVENFPLLVFKRPESKKQMLILCSKISSNHNIPITVIRTT